jgi:hypothetical protein
MIAEDDPFGGVRIAKRSDHVVDRAREEIHFEFHVRDRSAGTHVISERQTPLPPLRNMRAAEVLQNRRGILGADRERGNFWKICGLGGRNALGGGNGGRIRSERIAGVNLSVFDRAALNARHRTPGAIRVSVTGHVTVVLRIGIKNESRGFVLFGEFRFDAAETPAVARDNDFPGDGDPERIELVVIIHHAVVDVHHRSGDFARGRVGVEGGEGAGLASIVVAGDRRLGRGERLFFRSGQFKRNFVGRRHPDGVADDFCVKTKAAKLIAKPFGILTALDRSRHVGMAREMAEIALGSRRIGNGAKLLLKLTFACHPRRQKPSDGIRRRSAAGEGERQKQCG